MRRVGKLGSPDAPSRVGRFVVTGVIGAGTSGTVYRGSDPATGRDVAVKVIGADDAERAGRVRGEANAMQQVHDPHCVEVVEVVDEPPLLAIVTALVEAATLRDVLARAGRLTGPQALGVLRGALLGLIAVHRAGLVHGDVKPANILVDRRGDALLIDFGLARVVGASQRGAPEGSPAYMSPEQARGEQLDARSDVYSCGAVLFELLTGRRPYPATTADAMLQSQLRAPVPDPRAVEPSVGDDLAMVCQTAMAKDPAQRYPTAQAFLDALEDAAQRRYGAAWLSGAGLGAAVAGLLDVGGPGRAGSPPARRARRIAMAGPVAAVLALALAIALTRSSHAARLNAGPSASQTPGPIASTTATASGTAAIAYTPCTSTALAALLPPPFPGDVVRPGSGVFDLSTFVNTLSVDPAHDRVAFAAAGFRCGYHRFAQSQVRGETIYLYQVRDAAAATHLLQDQVRLTTGPSATPFPVSGIPGAYGHQLAEGAASGRFYENDVLFSCGHFLVQSGFGYRAPTSAGDAVDLAQRVLAAIAGRC